MTPDELIPEVAAIEVLERILETAPPEARDEAALTRLTRDLFRECAPELAAWREKLDGDERAGLVVLAIDPFALLPWLALAEKSRGAVMRRARGLESLLARAIDELEKPKSVSPRGAQALSLAELAHVDEWVAELREHSAQMMDIASTMDDEAEAIVDDITSRLSTADAEALTVAIVRIRAAAYEAGRRAAGASDDDDPFTVDDDDPFTVDAGDQAFRADLEATMRALIPPTDPPKPKKTPRG